MSTLDRIDRAILEQLQQDARITLTKLSSRVGISKTPCQIRMRRLENEGFILKYSAQVNQQKLGNRHIAFVQVNLSDTRTRALESFNREARKIAEIEECHMIASNFDYLLKVRTTDIESYRNILGEKISSLPHVTHTSTFVVMEAVRDSSAQNV
ncbi:MAG: Lrp/AsnC ligand binding domain-containing protein [Pseudomonadota bacterium]